MSECRVCGDQCVDRICDECDSPAVSPIAAAQARVIEATKALICVMRESPGMKAGYRRMLRTNRLTSELEEAVRALNDLEKGETT